MKTVELNVNGRTRSARIDDTEMPLLYFLRNELGLKGTHFGCGLGQCGACTVQIDGVPARSCLVQCGGVQGNITTIEGIANDPAHRDLIQAFEEMQAAQCGYCTGGMVVTAAALLQRESNPTREQVLQALDSNLCRCGTHLRYLAAVERAVAIRTRKTG